MRLFRNAGAGCAIFRDGILFSNPETNPGEVDRLRCLSI